MSVLEILEGTLALLAAPEQWTKGSYARDKDGVPVAPHSVDAVCWCIQGAVSKVALDPDKCDAEGIYVNINASQAFYLIHPQWETWLWNDSPERTFADIQTGLQSAIAKKRAELAQPC